MKTSSIDTIHSVASPIHQQDILFEYMRILKPGGIVILYEPLANRTFEMSENLKTNLTLAGFLHPKISALGQWIQITSEKPNWELGTTQKITFKKRKIESDSQNNTNSSNNQNTKWSLDIGNENDLIDEDTLLDESDLIKPSKKGNKIKDQEFQTNLLSTFL